LDPVTEGEDPSPPKKFNKLLPCPMKLFAFHSELKPLEVKIDTKSGAFSQKRTSKRKPKKAIECVVYNYI